jgi:hypothetical protein
MATRTERTRKPPRFMLSLNRGRVCYTCRGCKQRYRHLASLLRHLQVCDLC